MPEHGGTCIILLCLAIYTQGKVNCSVNDLVAPHLTSFLKN